MCVFLCVLTRASIFVLGSVILCLVYFMFVVVWLSVPVSEMICYVSSGRKLNPTHSLTHLSLPESRCQ